MHALLSQPCALSGLEALEHMWVLFYVLPLFFWPLSLLGPRAQRRRRRVLALGFWLYVGLQALAYCFVRYARATSEDWLMSLAVPQLIAAVGLVGNLVAVVVTSESPER